MCLGHTRFLLLRVLGCRREMQLVARLVLGSGLHMAPHIGQTCPDRKNLGQNILNGLHHVIEDLVGNQIFASHQNVDPTAALWQPEIGRTQWLPGLGPLN